MTGAERKGELVKKAKVIDIAARTGYGKAFVSMVLGGTRRNRKVEVAIARAIGRPVDEVFAPQLDAKRKVS